MISLRRCWHSAVVGRLTNNNYLDFDNLLVLKLSFCALDAHHRILHPSMIFKFNSFGVDNLFKRFSY
jgi:hypothetical protein